MASTDSDAEDAITKDEITGAASAPPVTETGISHGTKRNACKFCLVLSCLASPSCLLTTSLSPLIVLSN